MKFKSILLFVVLVAIIASFSLVSCHKDEPVGDVYSEWMDMSAADSVIYARARTAYLEDPANKGTADFMIMQILSQNPYAVRTEAVEKGLNYHFACFDNYVVTVYKGTGDKVGKVIEIEEGFNVDGFPGPIPPDPRKGIQSHTSSIEKSTAEMLAQAEKYIESQGFHLMTKDEIPKFARCAAESYGDIYYALDDYFVGHPCTKDELWEMWLFNLKYFYSRALIYSDSSECNGWTLWVPPGCKGVSMINFIRYGGIRMALKMGLPAMRRIMHYENYSARVRLNATGGREWYGYNLVVRPEAQGQHLAGKLLRPMLEYCAQTGRPAYLETHSEKNAGIYRHFGFEVVSDGTIPGTEVTHWGMVK